MDTREREKLTKKITDQIITYLQEETDLGIQFEEMEDYEEKEFKENIGNIVRRNIPVTVKKKL